jgi:predicted transcriptional regulator
MMTGYDVVICGHMGTVRTISFRIREDRVAALDALAASQHRDRSYLLNEAVERYLELNAAEIADIEARLRESESEEGVSQSEAEAIVAKWRTAS